MKKFSKRKKAWLEKIKEEQKYGLDDAIVLLKEFSKLKFNSTVDVIFLLGIDPSKGEQSVKGSCVLPHGTGKTVKVLVFAKGEKEKEARESGADFAGNKELIDKIQEGWLDFDRVVATPDMMSEVSKIGKILGPKGLMPNPKMDTVTMDIAGAIKRIKKGQVEFRNDKAANIHTSVGKINFSTENLKENILSMVESVTKLKPATSKGIYLQKLHISSTMGPGIEIKLQDLN